MLLRLLSLLLLFASVPVAIMNLATECLETETKTETVMSYSWSYRLEEANVEANGVSSVIADRIFEDNWLRVAILPLWDKIKSKRAEFVGFAVGLQNKTNDELRITWDESVAVLPDSRISQVVHGDVRRIFEGLAVKPTVIPPRAKVSLSVYPIALDTGGGLEPYELSPGDKAVLYLKMNRGNASRGYTFTLAFEREDSSYPRTYEVCTKSQSIWKKTFGAELPTWIKTSAYILAAFELLIILAALGSL